MGTGSGEGCRCLSPFAGCTQAAEVPARIPGQRITRTRLIQTEKYVVAVDVEMVVPIGLRDQSAAQHAASGSSEKTTLSDGPEREALRQGAFSADCGSSWFANRFRVR